MASLPTRRAMRTTARPSLDEIGSPIRRIMAGHDDEGEYEAALRRLPEAHSLALRLRAAGAADDVICEYLRIEPEALATLLELADRKLQRELRKRRP